jgi:L-cysteine desulfidase
MLPWTGCSKKWLSAICGCDVAAGIGANVGVVYLLGGTVEQML